MLWVQAFACLAAWLGYGYVLFRRSRTILGWAVRLPARRRATLGPFFLVGGAALMAVGIVLLDLIGGFAKDRLTPSGWLLTTVFGLGFVHSQVLGASLLVTLADRRVTPPSQQSSEGTEESL